MPCDVVYDSLADGNRILRNEPMDEMCFSQCNSDGQICRRLHELAKKDFIKYLIGTHRNKALERLGCELLACGQTFMEAIDRCLGQDFLLLEKQTPHVVLFGYPYLRCDLNSLEHLLWNTGIALD